MRRTQNLGALLFAGFGLASSAVTVEKYSYVGCYTESVSKHEFDYWPGVSRSDMTIPMCAEMCEGYSFFGLHAGDNCFCGDSFGRYGKADNGKCNWTCRGGTGQYCGGYMEASVYKFNKDKFTFKQAVFPNTLGCYKFNNKLSQRYYMGSIPRASPQECMTKCYDYPYYYLVSGTNCYCGVVNSKNSLEADGKCNSRCEGDKRFSCGGKASEYMTVFKNTNYLPATVYEYKGCVDFKTNTPPTAVKTFDGNVPQMTIETCNSLCRQFEWFSLRDSRNCYCGQGSPWSFTIGEKNCKKKCDGNSTQICGDTSYHSLYRIARIPESPYTPGCYPNHLEDVRSAATCMDVCYATDKCGMMGYATDKSCYLMTANCNYTLNKTTTVKNIDKTYKPVRSFKSYDIVGNYACGGSDTIPLNKLLPAETLQACTVLGILNNLAKYVVWFSDSKKCTLYIGCKAGVAKEATIIAGLDGLPAPTGVVVKGTVTLHYEDEDGVAFAKMKVQLLDANGNVVANGTTDDKGDVQFSVPVGKYTGVPVYPEDRQAESEHEFTEVVVGAGENKVVAVVAKVAAKTVDYSAQLLDSDGQPLKTVKVGLYNSQGTLVATVDTDESGTVLFKVPIGKYKLYPLNDDGTPNKTAEATTLDIESEQTTPEKIVTPIKRWQGTVTVSEEPVPSSSIVPTGTVIGSVYNDKNKNGRIDSGEALSGVKVTLLDSNNEVYGEEVVTDDNGAYSFKELPSGKYTVVVGKVPNFKVDTAQARKKVNVTPNSTSVFDLRIVGNPTATSGTVKPKVFIDENGNEDYDKGEEVFEGAPVTLYSTSDRSVVAEAVTDDTGSAVLDDVPFGDYIISVDVSKWDYLGTPAIEGYIQVSTRVIAPYFAIQVE